MRSHLPPLRAPTRLSGVRTRYGESICWATALPRPQAVERPASPLPSKADSATKLSRTLAFIGRCGSVDSGLYGLPATRSTLPVARSVRTRTPHMVVQPRQVV